MYKEDTRVMRQVGVAEYTHIPTGFVSEALAFLCPMTIPVQGHA